MNLAVPWCPVATGRPIQARRPAPIRTGTSVLWGRREWEWTGRERWTAINKKAFITRWFLMFRISQVQKYSHELCNGRCPWDVFINIPKGLFCPFAPMGGRKRQIRRGDCINSSAWVQRCTLKDYISYLLPTWLSVGTGKLKRKHHFIGWQERTNKMKNKSCATNFATQQPFSLLLLLQEPFLLAERKKMCYLSMAANQSQYTNINSFILGYIY